MVEAEADLPGMMREGKTQIQRRLAITEEQVSMLSINIMGQVEEGLEAQVSQMEMEEMVFLTILQALSYSMRQVVVEDITRDKIGSEMVGVALVGGAVLQMVFWDLLDYRIRVPEVEGMVLMLLIQEAVGRVVLE